MIKRMIKSPAFWGFVLIFSSVTLVLDFVGWIEPRSDLTINMVRVAVVASFIFLLGNAARH